MNILFMGVGMQGKAALHDLWQNPAVTGIVAADREVDELRRYVQHQNYGTKIFICAPHLGHFNGSTSYTW